MSLATAPTKTAQTAHKTAILAIILVSFFMVILDNSIIFTGLPAIREEMGFSDAGLAWIQDAYTLTFGGLLLLAARTGDILGRRRLFIVGLVIFTIASILVAVATDPAFMIGARALQGVGSAIVAPTSLALLMTTFDEGAERSRAVALYAAVAGIGASIGLILGGAFAELISWRAGFLLNLPIGVLMIVLTLRFVPESTRTRGRFDIAGAVLSTLGMTAVIYGIVESSLHGWGAITSVGPIIVGMLLLGGFVVNEWRAPQPIMPLRLFASAVRSSAYGIRLLYMGAFIGFFFFLTQYLQEVLGWNALQAGLGFLPMTVVNFAVAMAVSPIIRRIGPIATLALGVFSTLVGMAWLSFAHADSSFLVDLAIPMVFVGAGQGLALAPMTDYGLRGVRAEDAGAASGLTNTAQQLGLSIGLAILIAITAGVPTGDDRGEQVMATTNLGLAGAAGMLAIALTLVLAVILPSEIRSRRRSLSADTTPAQHAGTEEVVVAH